MSIPVASVLAVKFFVPLYRKIGNISACYYLEIRFGPWARTYASVCCLITQLKHTGAILRLLAMPLNALFGWNMKTITIFTGMAVTFYSMMGGIRTVVWTDAIQGILLIAGAVVYYYKRYFNKPAGVIASMRVRYISSTTMGFLGVLIAFSLIGVESILDAWWALASIFSGGMLVFFLLAFLTRSVKQPAAVAGVVAGVLVIAWMSPSPVYFKCPGLIAFRSSLHSNLTIVIGTLVIFFVGFIITNLFSSEPTNN